MKDTLLNEHGGLRTFAIVLDTGDEAMAAIASFAAARHLRASQFTAIGAFSRVVVAYFDWETKESRKTSIGEQVEGHVRPTLEIVLTETPAHLERHFDPETGLTLIVTE